MLQQMEKEREETLSHFEKPTSFRMNFEIELSFPHQGFDGERKGFDRVISCVSSKRLSSEP